jgi:hypothetical protein
VNITGSQPRFRYPPAYLGSAPPSGHPAFTAITTPPPCKPRNKKANAPATKSITIAVCVWWQHIVVVAIEAGIVGREVDIVGWEVDIIDKEVDVLETEVDLIDQDVEDQEVDVFETKVDLIDQDVDVFENEVDVLDQIVDVVDAKFKGIEFEKFDVEGQGVVDKDEFRVTSDFQIELVLFDSAWRVEQKHIKMTKHNRTQPVGYIAVSLAESIACISSLGFCASCLTSYLTLKEIRGPLLNSCVKPATALLAFLQTLNTKVTLRPNALDDKSGLGLRVLSHFEGEKKPAR